MSDLLSIPRELRNHIIDAVIHIPSAAPTTYEDFAHEQRISLRSQSAWNKASSRILLRKSVIPASDAGALSQTNVQLRDEVHDALEDLRRQPMQYVLDLAYLKDVTFRPTWISVPQLRSHLDTLVARFRVIDVPRQLALSEDVQKFYELRDGGRSPPLIVETFYTILRTCLHWGPLGTNTISKASTSSGFDPLPLNGITVDVLIIDFLPADPEVLPIGPNVSQYFQRGLKRIDQNLEWLGKSFAIGLEDGSRPCYTSTQIE
ncbi:hypothetical protein E8E14_005484 [Neopestalotiopsis sp. 37M]|nr:hypothetical protein E8E14_005484 [Neopestalotiopsis sp. 37M]